MIPDFPRPAGRLRALPLPRPATAIALLALVMATGGTSLASSVLSGSALTNGSVTRNKIAKNAIDATRLAGNAVTTSKLAPGSVNAARLAKAAVTAPALAPGAVTGSALGAGVVSWKSLGAQVVAAPPVALPVGTTNVVPATGTATCPTGTAAISGGESISDVANAFVIQAVQVGGPGAAPTGWTATGATAGIAPATMTVYAICVNAGA